MDHNFENILAQYQGLTGNETAQTLEQLMDSIKQVERQLHTRASLDENVSKELSAISKMKDDLANRMSRPSSLKEMSERPVLRFLNKHPLLKNLFIALFLLLSFLLVITGLRNCFKTPKPINNNQSVEVNNNMVDSSKNETKVDVNVTVEQAREKPPAPPTFHIEKYADLFEADLHQLLNLKIAQRKNDATYKIKLTYDETAFAATGAGKPLYHLHENNLMVQINDRPPCATDIALYSCTPKVKRSGMNKSILLKELKKDLAAKIKNPENQKHILNAINDCL